MGSSARRWKGASKSRWDTIVAGRAFTSRSCTLCGENQRKRAGLEISWTTSARRWIATFDIRRSPTSIHRNIRALFKSWNTLGDVYLKPVSRPRSDFIPPSILELYTARTRTNKFSRCSPQCFRGLNYEWRRKTGSTHGGEIIVIRFFLPLDSRWNDV